MNNKKKVGLALSGGGARGLAHIGVLDVLHQAGIPIDLIAGTSAGAIMGAVYASRLDTEKMLEYALDPAWKKFTPMVDPTVEKSGFLKGRKIKNLLTGFIGGDLKFTDLKIPFACVATDIDTGEEVVINNGPVIDAVRASISIPGIFTVVRREGRYLVDGGLTTPVPINVVRHMGADFIIAVNVNPDVSQRMSKTSTQRAKARREPNIFQILMQSFYITTYSLARSCMLEADITIEPDLGHTTFSDFRLAKEFIDYGREAAEEALPEIKRRIKGLGLS